LSSPFICLVNCDDLIYFWSFSSADVSRPLSLIGIVDWDNSYHLGVSRYYTCPCWDMTTPQ